MLSAPLQEHVAHPLGAASVQSTWCGSSPLPVLAELELAADEVAAVELVAVALATLELATLEPSDELSLVPEELAAVVVPLATSTLAVETLGLEPPTPVDVALELAAPPVPLEPP